MCQNGRQGTRLESENEGQRILYYSKTGGIEMAPKFRRGEMETREKWGRGTTKKAGGVGATGSNRRGIGATGRKARRRGCIHMCVEDVAESLLLQLDATKYLQLPLYAAS